MRTIDQPNLPHILQTAATIFACGKLTAEQSITLAFVMWDEVLRTANERQEFRDGGDK